MKDLVQAIADRNWYNSKCLNPVKNTITIQFRIVKKLPEKIQQILYTQHPYLLTVTDTYVSCQLFDNVTSELCTYMYNVLLAFWECATPEFLKENFIYLQELQNMLNIHTYASNGSIVWTNEKLLEFQLFCEEFIIPL